MSGLTYLWDLEKNVRVKNENNVMIPELTACGVNLKHEVGGGGLHMDYVDEW